MSNSKQFKSIILKVTEDDKKRAMVALVNAGKKPTLRNARLLLREWAKFGLEKGWVVT